MATGLKLSSGILRNRFIAVRELAELYKPAINRQKEKLIEIIRERVEAASKTKAARKLRVFKEYYKVEMSPPDINEMQKLQLDLALVREFIATGCYKYLTVKQAWLLFLVGLEISLWFFLGETVGKWSLVGYKV